MKELTIILSEQEVKYLANRILEETWIDELDESKYECFSAIPLIRDNCNIAGFNCTENDVKVCINVEGKYQGNNYYVDSCDISEFCAYNPEEDTCLHLAQESIDAVCKAIEGRKINLVSPYIGIVEPF